MPKKIASRGELLDRWRGIEEEEEEVDENDPSKQRRLNQHKEEWFADAFNFLICLPKETHTWCGCCDIMGPLLETFYNYFKDERHDCPLRLLWKRISEELRHCIQCISQHHQAQEMYDSEYEFSSIGPLLGVLRNLDEERLTQHLQEINARLAREEYDPQRDSAEVVSVMYEVLMFPVLLDDQSLFTEFEKFIEAVDSMHELALAGHQQFPGVYALLFFNRRVRIVGHRLARSMGKLRRATDLEPLQPLLKKFIGWLETEGLPSGSQASRPRAQLERLSVWHGITSLLEFLEPPAFEDGILERYPIFFDIVLNHVSGDSPEFSEAVSCLKELLKMLGCKLWLRSTLSPSVMRNTLLGQCFHTRNEKSHKVIFDLFQPFLQSLEALQDGEHEKQRRHFLYFLLHQVPASSNFSVLTRKIACKIGILIIHRGYQMNPPCPPFECAHMWGPALVMSLKDSSLHTSLRQPAFDLIQTIMVSDAAALVTSVLNSSLSKSVGNGTYIELNDDEDDNEVPFSLDSEEKDCSCWIEFATQSKITSGEYRGWMCIPMLWIEVLVDINPSILPILFSKAVFWARSRFCLVEPEISTEIVLDVKVWLSSYAKEISTALGWKVPTGSDDGGGGKESKNSVKLSTMCLPLIRTFKRLTTHFLVQMGQGELRKQWTWEPRMAESLILSLLDPNDNVRQFGKYILEQVSNTRGLSCGLKFICSYSSSLSAAFLGFRHALKLVQLDSVLLNFQTLHHFLFVLCKLLKEGDVPKSDLPENLSEGGFLRQPVFDSAPVGFDCGSSTVDLKSWERFCCLLSEVAWPPIRKCLVEGKAFFDYSLCQMTCVRLLEILPVLLERLHLSFCKWSGASRKMEENVYDFKWLHDLMDWGKSQLKVVIVYWKRTLTLLLNQLKESCSNASLLAVRAIEDLISCDNVDMDELTNRVSRLCVSLSKEVSTNMEKTILKSKALSSEGLPVWGKLAASVLQPPNVEDADLQILDSLALAHKSRNNVIVLSDDEIDKKGSDNVAILSDKSSNKVLDTKTVASVDKSTSLIDSVKKNISGPDTSKYLLDVYEERDSTASSCLVPQKQDVDKLRGESLDSLKSKGVDVDKSTSLIDSVKKNISGPDTSKYLLDVFEERDSTASSGLLPQKQDVDKLRGKSLDSLKSKGVGGMKKEIKTRQNLTDSLSSQCKSDLKNASDRSVSLKNVNKACNNMLSRKGDMILKELVCDTEDDPLESAFKSKRKQQPYLAMSGPLVPKRQVIQLNSPLENRTGYLQRLGAGFKRFKAPRLDDWYRRILELDYFATVGLTSINEDENQTVTKFKEVPVCFQSSEQYVNIFQPLILEEFKAQLHSSFLEMSSLEEMYCGNLSVLSVERVDDFHLVRFVHDDNDSMTSRSFLENDLVLLTKEPPQSSTHDIHVVGKVERRERDDKRRSSILLIRFYLQNGSSRLNQVRRNLLERSKWNATRIMSITPQIREFQALSSINDIPILPVILQPVSDSVLYNKSKELDLGKLSQPLQQILTSSFNETQLQAISVAIGSSSPKKDFELSLIQGPPGTGKTRTIVAIVSGLLASTPQKTPDAESFNDNVKQSNNFSTNSRPRMNQSAAVARAWQDAALARQLNEDVESNKRPTESFARGRVLICAQSNAAVDELVSRISSAGLYGRDGKMYKPYLVRVGNAKTVHLTSLPFFIDTLVDQRLVEERMHLSDAKNNSGLESSMTLRANLEKLVDRIRFYETKRANINDRSSEIKSSLEDETNDRDDGKEMSDAELGVKLRRLYEQKRQIYKDLSAAQVQERRANEETKALKHKLRKSILREAQIVVTTLSGCGGDLYGVCSESISSYKFGCPSEHTLFDAVVVDEAAQALEPATLIPLQLLKSKGTKCIMVGDPKQLPATVLSNVASKFLYQCSMFERLQRAGYPVVMLTQQYRMHPEICRFPSLHFYNSKLLNGERMSIKSAAFHETFSLGPYVFYDIVDGRELRGENSGALSLYNEHEADAAVQLLRFFKKRYPSEFVGGRIGVITPYKRQLSLLRSRFISAFGSSVIADMEFNTVDGFQGREVDILVLSTVRAADSCDAPRGVNSNSIGFVADARRMNVALTRAKLSLWILGNARTLQANHNWAALVKDAKERNLVISVKRPYKSMFNGTTCALENPECCSKQFKNVEKVNSQFVKQNECRVNPTSERETKIVDGVALNSGKAAVDDISISSERVDSHSNRRRLRDERGFLKKDLSSADANGENITSRSVKIALSGELVTDGECKDKNKGQKCTGKKLSLENTHLDKKRHDSHKNLEMNMMDKSKKFDKSQKVSEASNPLTKGRQKDREAKGGNASNHSGASKELILKRKRQREAVDAILYSSLISSKKSETSFKPAPPKRPLSPTSKVSGAVKPPKARAGTARSDPSAPK